MKAEMARLYDGSYHLHLHPDTFEEWKSLSGWEEQGTAGDNNLSTTVHIADEMSDWGRLLAETFDKERKQQGYTGHVDMQSWDERSHDERTRWHRAAVTLARHVHRDMR